MKKSITLFRLTPTIRLLWHECGDLQTERLMNFLTVYETLPTIYLTPNSGKYQKQQLKLLENFFY